MLIELLYDKDLNNLKVIVLAEVETPGYAASHAIKRKGRVALY